jgi:hypothetical protein
MRFVVAAWWLLSMGVFANAGDFPTGNDVLEGCRRASSLRYGSTVAEALLSGDCSGTVRTLFGIGSHLQENMRFCIPGEVTFQQAGKVFVRYLDTHPERLHELYIILAVDAFRAVWPCKKSN